MGLPDGGGSGEDEDAALLILSSLTTQPSTLEDTEDKEDDGEDKKDEEDEDDAKETESATFEPTATPTPTRGATPTVSPAPTATAPPPGAAATPTPTARSTRSPSPTASPLPSTATPTSTTQSAAVRRIGVPEADVPTDRIRAGHRSTVRVTVRNPGRSRDFEVDVTHPGVPVTTVAIPLTDGKTATYELGIVFTDPRRGAVAVDGVPAGEVTVVPADEPSPTPGAGTDADGGVGPATGLVVAILAVLLWRCWPADGW